MALTDHEIPATVTVNRSKDHERQEPKMSVYALPVGVEDSGAWELASAQWQRKLRARNLSPATIEGYRDSLAFLARWALTQPAPVTDPADMTSGDLDAFFD